MNSLTITITTATNSELAAMMETLRRGDGRTAAANTMPAPSMSSAPVTPSLMGITRSQSGVLSWGWKTEPQVESGGSSTYEAANPIPAPRMISPASTTTITKAALSSGGGLDIANNRAFYELATPKMAAQESRANAERRFWRVRVVVYVRRTRSALPVLASTTSRSPRG